MNSHKTWLPRLATVLAAGLFAYSSTAAPVVIPDFSFENELTADNATSGVGTNWVASGNGGFYILNPQDIDFPGSTGDLAPLAAPADGTNCFVINLGYPGYCWQTIGTFQPSTTYTLTVAVGLSANTAGGVGQIALVNGPNAFASILATTVVDSSLLSPGTFADSTLVFTTGQKASGPLTILLEGDFGTQIIFDNVRLDATPTVTSALALPVTASPGSNVFVGTSVTLAEDPAGKGPFIYQWQTDNGTGGATWSPVPGATAATLTVDTTGFPSGAPILYQVTVGNTGGSTTSPPLTLTANVGAPIVVRDSLPTTGSDSVGSSMTFTAVMDGSRPLSLQWLADTGSGPTPVPGATNATLTLTNLQLTDSGFYQLMASNALGTTYSSGTTFYVNDTPPATNNVLVYPATQLGAGGPTHFTPTWTLPTTNLLSGLAPSGIGTGNYSEGASGTVGVLTDGRYGTLYPAGNGSLDFVTCGPGGGAGTFVTYTLPASATGWDITNITVFGGWSDAGRDQQRYLVYYSTTATPTVFNLLANVNFNPTNPAPALQSATRATLVSATTDPLAKNVAAIKFDFTPLAAGVENGFAGYSEVEAFGVHSAPAPVVAANTLPVTGSDVVGSSVTFTAAFSSTTPLTYQWRVDHGSGPVAIPGATNTTLTLTNLQLADTASPGYSLLAANASGTAATKASSFVVNPVPAPDVNGIIAAPANQTGSGAFFTPTWSFAPGSLLAGLLPSGVGSGNFRLENAGGLPVLTDGTFGMVGSGNDSTLATAGNSGSAGHYVVYNLTGSASGYDITNIMTFGGWSDGGRDSQAYTLSYATAQNPNSFTTVTSTSYNPTLPGSVPSTTRYSITAAAGGAIAQNVVQLKFDFTTPTSENGYQGYAELEAYGTPSAAVVFAPVVQTDTLPVTAADVVGSSVSFVANLTSSAPLSYQWVKDTGAGPVPVPGAHSPTLTLSNLQLTDAANPGYSLIGSNALGVVQSTPRQLTVNAFPAPVNNVYAAIATQTGPGVNLFSPTWVIPAGSLIAGQLPSTVGAGNFGGTGLGTLAGLTDGTFGGIFPPGNNSTSLVGGGAGGAGNSVIYTLPAAANGFTLTNITTYGGWSDGGRDQQHYTISCATVSHPTTFTTLGSVNFNPSLPGAVQSTVRATLTPASGILASQVTQVKFDFTSPGGENNWSGYGEISLFGAPTPVPATSFNAPVLAANGSLILTGGGGIPGTGYTWLTTTNLATPLANWTTNSTGVFDANGAYSNSLPTGASARFYRLRQP